MRPEFYRLEGLSVRTASGEAPEAEVEVFACREQETVLARETGTGPVDAIIRAIEGALETGPLDVESLTYRSIGEGSDGVGEATVLVGYLGATFRGVGLDTDVLRASAEAYVDALNRIEHFRSDESNLALIENRLYRAYESGIA